MKTDEQVRALFENECDRLREGIRALVHRPDFETMPDEDLVIYHRAAVAAAIATLGELLSLIPNPTIREEVRQGALSLLAPMPSSEELH